MTNDAHDETTTAGPAAAHPPFERLSDLADGGGALAGAERAAVERHVAACAACRAELEALRRVLALAQGAPRAVEPPPELWAGVRARLAPRSAVVGHLSWRRAPVLAAAAAVLAVASVGLLAARAERAERADRAERVERAVATAPSLDDRLAMTAFAESVAATMRDSVVAARAREPGASRLARNVLALLRLERASGADGVAAALPNHAVVRQTFALDRAATELASTVRARESGLPPEARAALTRSLGVVDTAVAEARAALIHAPDDAAVADALAAAQERRLELLRQAARFLSED